MVSLAALVAALSPAAMAEDQSTPSSVLRSLPAEVKGHIDDLQKACRELREDSYLPEGDYALTQFTLRGRKAVMVNDMTICGGECLRGANCTNRNSYYISIYVRTESGWRRVFKEEAQGETFLSLDSGLEDSSNDRFRLLAIRIFSGNKQCPVREKGPMAWKLSCDATVTWNGNKFVIKPIK
jgi:hypothetical protein